MSSLTVEDIRERGYAGRRGTFTPTGRAGAFLVRLGRTRVLTVEGASRGELEDFGWQYIREGENRV